MNLLDLDYEVPLDKDLNQFGIGVIGAGFIIRDCHLVAYQQAGFRVLGIASRNPQRAAEVALLRGIPHVYQHYRELLTNPEIQILDIGVPPQHQPAIIREIVQHAKHVRGILAQKPLAMSYAEAKEIVDLCESAGITLAVNQNMRHDHSVRG
ncbi:MAG: afr 2, partial [Planctomycetaceae bacterium]|nr:afr 2 [Planctomycetaceae bacterium]